MPITAVSTEAFSTCSTVYSRYSETDGSAPPSSSASSVPSIESICPITGISCMLLITIVSMPSGRIRWIRIATNGSRITASAICAPVQIRFFTVNARMGSPLLRI